MSFYNKMLSQFQEMYYLGIVLGIIASSCIGSIAASLALKNLPGFVELFQLCVAVGTAMWFNASVLAQLNIKTVFNSLLISVIANTLIIILHLA